MGAEMMLRKGLGKQEGRSFDYTERLSRPRPRCPEEQDSKRTVRRLSPQQHRSILGASTPTTRGSLGTSLEGWQHMPWAQAAHIEEPQHGQDVSLPAFDVHHSHNVPNSHS